MGKIRRISSAIQPHGDSFRLVDNGSCGPRGNLRPPDTPVDSEDSSETVAKNGLFRFIEHAQYGCSAAAIRGFYARGELVKKEKEKAKQESDKDKAKKTKDWDNKKWGKKKEEKTNEKSDDPPTRWGGKWAKAGWAAWSKRKEGEKSIPPPSREAKKTDATKDAPKTK